MTWGTPAEEETRKRIFLSVAAYAYECMGESLLSDTDFDALALSVNLEQETANKELDRWWRENFQPHTGMWIHQHPHQKRLREIAVWIMGQ